MPSSYPRYLAWFHPKHVSHFFTDILVIGGGLAGLRTALAVNDRQRALLVTKADLLESNSVYAQGGIAGVLSTADSFEQHIEDTINVGGPLCDVAVVRRVVREGPTRIRELIEWGTQFDHNDAGHMALAREGGHSRDRVAHCQGDATGREIIRAVIQRAREAANIKLWDNTFTLDLLTHEDRCQGAIVWSPMYGKTLIWAKQIVLATGGVGQIYRETTNPDVATGDGIAMAYRAGAEVRDLEFMQFHPTVLYIAGSSRSLISEAVRGEGAHLVDRHGHRFMSEYDPRGELAPRDVVSWAIVSQMEKTRHTNVYLDLTHLDPEWVHRRFPGIAATCAKFGLDIARDRIPVRPGAHYMMGGVTIDADGRTTLPGLWAAGEVTASGLHGANRLASNSLLESLVYGAAAGEGASCVAGGIPDGFQALPLEHPYQEPNGAPLDLADIRNSLKSLMWRNVGVRRDATRLSDAQSDIDHWCSYVLARQFQNPTGWELQNMLHLGRLMIEAALTREESRGCHVRTDYPEVDEQRWVRHLAYRRDR